MKEKLMIIIENFLNLFSDWEFFLSNWEKNRVFCIGTGAHNRPLRYTEKIPAAPLLHLPIIWIVRLRTLAKVTNLKLTAVSMRMLVGETRE